MTTATDNRGGKATVTIYKYFGTKEGQTRQDFMKEVKELTMDDRLTLAEGIDNGTLTY